MEVEKTSNEKKENVFEILGPKRSFTLGIIIAVMGFCTVGFFYLLATGAEPGAEKASATKTFGVINSAPSGDTASDVGTTVVAIDPVTSDDHIKGDLDTAEVVIVEYSDLECPFCKRFHPTVQEVYDNNNGKVAWVYRHFPLDSLHSKARKEAEATECATELGGNEAFWKYTDRLFELTPSNNGLDLAVLPDVAEYVGLDRQEFSTCLDSGKYADKVEAQYQDATVNAGGQGTPHSVIVSNDGRTKAVSGAVGATELQTAIDVYLQ